MYIKTSFKEYIKENIDNVEMWYHVSPTENKNNILQSGLNINSDKRYNGISKQGIYLWKYSELALWYALTESRDYNKSFDIFQISQNIKVEEDLTIGVPHSYITCDNILPENIKLIDTVCTGDKRIRKFGDIEYVLQIIEDK